MTKKELGIKTLKYPTWFTILFSILTVVMPVILVVREGLKVPNSAFRISFMVISVGLITWVMLNKYVIGKMRQKLIAKQTALEHDYSIDNGNPTKIKYLWFANEQLLTMFEGLSVLFTGGFIALVLTGVATSFMKIRLAVAIIIMLYVIAYTIKFMLILTMKGDDYEGTNR